MASWIVRSENAHECDTLQRLHRRRQGCFVIRQTVQYPKSSCLRGGLRRSALEAAQVASSLSHEACVNLDAVDGGGVEAHC